MAQRYVMSPAGGLPLPKGTLGDDLAVAYPEPSLMARAPGSGGSAALPPPTYLQSRDTRLREIQHARRAMGSVQQARASLAQGPGSVAPFAPPPVLGPPGYGPSEPFTIPRAAPPSTSSAPAATHGGTLSPGLRQPFDASVADSGVGYADPVIGPLPPVQPQVPAETSPPPAQLPFIPTPADYIPTGQDWSGGTFNPHLPGADEYLSETGLGQLERKLNQFGTPW